MSEPKGVEMREQIHRDGKTIAFGKDHVFGYFAQVWENTHPDGCECETCEYDLPTHEGDRLDGWTGVIGFIREKTGVDVTPEIVGVPG